MKRILVAFVILVIAVIAANMISQQKLYFAALSSMPFGPPVDRMSDSPGGKYAVHFVNDSFQGFHYEIFVSRWFYIKPKFILAVSGEDFHCGIGPLKDSLCIVWSRDNRYAALVHRPVNNVGYGFLPIGLIEPLIRQGGRLCQRRSILLN